MHLPFAFCGRLHPTQEGLDMTRSPVIRTLALAGLLAASVSFAAEARVLAP